MHNVRGLRLDAALVWAASWDMCRDGEMAARDFFRLVLGGVDSVRDISVVQTLLRQATLLVRHIPLLMHEVLHTGAVVTYKTCGTHGCKRG